VTAAAWRYLGTLADRWRLDERGDGCIVFLVVEKKCGFAQEEETKCGTPARETARFFDRGAIAAARNDRVGWGNIVVGRAMTERPAMHGTDHLP
jgi:hypothetical protein